MTHFEPKLPLPNPDDWLDFAGAAAILGTTPRAINHLIGRTPGRRTVLHAYSIGCHTMFWRYEVEALAAARRVARGIRTR